MQYSERLRNYELEKSRLLKSNKPMSSAEYEAFIRALADKWGI